MQRKHAPGPLIFVGSWVKAAIQEPEPRPPLGWWPRDEVKERHVRINKPRAQLQQQPPGGLL